MFKIVLLKNNEEWLAYIACKSDHKQFDIDPESGSKVITLSSANLTNAMTSNNVPNIHNTPFDVDNLEVF